MHSTKSSDTSSQTFVSTDFPCYKQWTENLKNVLFLTENKQMFISQIFIRKCN